MTGMLLAIRGGLNRLSGGVRSLQLATALSWSISDTDWRPD
jgi:hypothetical protein